LHNNDFEESADAIAALKSALERNKRISSLNSRTRNDLFESVCSVS
jgi:hypothetical protein